MLQSDADTTVPLQISEFLSAVSNEVLLSESRVRRL